MDTDGGEGWMFGVEGDRLDVADAKSAREDAVATTGEDVLSGLDAIVREKSTDLQDACGGAAQDAPCTCGFEDDPGSRAGIVDEKKLGCCGVNVAELADDTIGRDDSHIGLQTVVRTFIEEQNVRLIGAARADDLCGDG